MCGAFLKARGSRLRRPPAARPPRRGAKLGGSGDALTYAHRPLAARRKAISSSTAAGHWNQISWRPPETLITNRKIVMVISTTLARGSRVYHSQARAKPDALSGGAAEFLLGSGRGARGGDGVAPWRTR